MPGEDTLTWPRSGGCAGRVVRSRGERRQESPVSEPSLQITRLLHEAPARPAALQELLGVVYDELHAIAARQFRGEKKEHTLQATALVHEVYLKLLGGAAIEWESRGHFFRAAAEAMRRILIDYARKRGTAKRGGGRRAIPLSAIDLADEHNLDDVLELDEALTQLAAEDAQAADIVRLRFYAGLSVAETAAALNISERTLMRDWSFARARLFELLGGG
jgi:RNA polymerase sigma factor (TIGR02999 family)